MWVTYDGWLVELMGWLEAKDIWAMLVRGDYVPDAVGHTHRSQVTPYEVSGNGYTKGGLPLGGRKLEVRDGLVVLKASPLVWPMATIRAGRVVLYRNSGNEVTDLLVQYLNLRDDRGVEAASRNADMEISWTEQGVLSIDFRAKNG